MIPVFKELFRLCTAAFFCSVLLVGCNETIDARQLKEINGLIYKIGKNEPFTGTVINFSQYDRFSKFERWSCEVHFKKGELHGAYNCVSVNTGIKTNEKMYEHNFKTSLETIWSRDGKIISKTQWIGGRRNGIEELYHPLTGKLLEQTNWLNDKLDGQQRKWDVTGEVLLCDLTWHMQKQNGFCKWDEWEENYKNGEFDGYRKHYILQGGYDELLAAKDAVRSASAGTYSFTMFKKVYLDWVEKYENGKRISKVLKVNVTPQSPEFYDSGNESALEPNTDYD